MVWPVSADYDSSIDQSLSKTHSFYWTCCHFMLQPLTTPLLLQGRPPCMGFSSEYSGSPWENLPAGLYPHFYWEHKNNSQQLNICPIFSSFLARMVEACKDWNKNVCHLTTLLVCLSSLLSPPRSQHIRKCCWLEWGYEIHLSKKQEQDVRGTESMSLDWLLFDFHSALPNICTTATHWSCRLTKCSVSSLSKAAGLPPSDSAGN